MTLLAIACLTVIVTCFGYVVVRPFAPFGNLLLEVSISWFVGNYLLIPLIVIVCAIVPFSEGSRVLQATTAALFLMAVLIGIWRRRNPIETESGFRELLPALYFLLPATILGAAYFSAHLALVDGWITISPVFWDFPALAFIIQSFAVGDNIPPENVQMAGVPMTYHYFYTLLCAVYQLLGLGLVDGFNVVSTLSFVFLCGLVLGFAKYLTGSYSIGASTMALFVTSGGLKWLVDLENGDDFGLRALFDRTVTMNPHPFLFALTPQLFGYNGVHFNIFYITEERQLIFGCAVMLIALGMLTRLEKLDWKRAALYGVALSAGILWHLYVTLLVTAILGLMMMHKRRGAYFAAFGGFSLVAVPYLYWLHGWMSDEQLFRSTSASVPALDFSFASYGQLWPLTWWGVILFYAISFGARLPLAVYGIGLVARLKTSWSLPVLGCMGLAFVLVNTVRISPLEAAENHKWLIPMNLLMCGVVAFAIHRTALPARTLTMGILLFLCTFGGLVELIPFARSRPELPFATPMSPAIDVIRNASRPGERFLAIHTWDVLMAGRRLFVGNPSEQRGTPNLADKIMNPRPRLIERRNILLASTVDEFCARLYESKVDFVQFDYRTKKLPIYDEVRKFPRFATTGRFGRHVYVSREGCGRAQ